MLTQIQGPSQHFNAYYQNNSLLIQFVVAELITTYQLVNQIKLCAHREFQGGQVVEEFIRPLFHFFNQLLGAGTEQEQFTSISRWTKGPLTKLKHYCDQLASNNRHQNKRILKLSHYVHQAWLSAMHNLELLNSLQQFHQPLCASIQPAIKRALNRLDKKIGDIVKHIPRILYTYQNDENVLFFLLRWKDALAPIYGTDFFLGIFKCFSTPNELPQLVMQRYLKRGFEHLLPLIQEFTLSEVI